MPNNQEHAEKNVKIIYIFINLSLIQNENFQCLTDWTFIKNTKRPEICPPLCQWNFKMMDGWGFSDHKFASVGSMLYIYSSILETPQ